LSLEWKSCKIGDLGKIFSGGTPSTKIEEYWNGNLNWLSSGETRNTYIYSTDKYITEKGAENSSTKLANKGDIVIASAGQGFTRGQSSMVMIDTFVNQSVIVIHPNEKVNNHYLLYNLKFRYPELRQLSDHASTRGSLTTKIIKGLDINLPDLNTQNKIATIIQYFDKKIETDKRINKNLIAIAKAKFRYSFINYEDYEGEFKDTDYGVIPETFEVYSLNEMSKNIVCGKTPSTKVESNYGDEMPFITIPDMHNNVFVINTERRLSLEGIKTQPKKTLPANSVCVSCIATAGLVSLTFEESQTNQQINSIICKDNICPYFMYLYLEELSEYIKLLGSGGSTTLNLNKNEFSKIKVAIPPQEDMDKFHSFVNPIFEKIKYNQLEIIELQNLRDTLLPKLMSGEIDVSKINCDLYFLLYLYLIYCDKFN